MAFLSSTNLAKAVLKKGTTWNTEADITSGGIFLFASNITVSGGFEDFIPRDFGTSGKRTNQKRLKATFNVSITCDMTFGQGWLALIASLLGTESTPSEQTASQGDYLRTIDLADTNDGLFWSLVYKVETNKTRAFPSLKIMSVSISYDAPGAGSITFNGIADDFIESSANTASEVDAVASLAYETAILGGTGMYLRYGNYSTSTALDSTVERYIQNVKIDLSRPMSAQHALRGASSFKAFEPTQQGDIDGMVEFTLFRLDASAYGDLMSDWYNATLKMAELHIKGSAIGTGLDRSLKFQFPLLQATGDVPGGQDLPGNNAYFTPRFKGRMLKAGSAPAGMASVTDYMRLTSVDTRSTKWTA